MIRVQLTRVYTCYWVFDNHGIHLYVSISSESLFLAGSCSRYGGIVQGFSSYAQFDHPFEGGKR